VLDADSAQGQINIVPARFAKGLEFDHVLVVEPARIVDGATTVGYRRLYVALTRAVSSLTVVHSQPMP